LWARPLIDRLPRSEAGLCACSLARARAAGAAGRGRSGPALLLLRRAWSGTPRRGRRDRHRRTDGRPWLRPRGARRSRASRNDSAHRLGRLRGPLGGRPRNTRRRRRHGRAGRGRHRRGRGSSRRGPRFHRRRPRRRRSARRRAALAGSSAPGPAVRKAAPPEAAPAVRRPVGVDGRPAPNRRPMKYGGRSPTRQSGCPQPRPERERGDDAPA
jgi:hypothetical protein